MKQNTPEYTTAIFPSRDTADIAIEQLHNELTVPSNAISYVVRDVRTTVTEVDLDDVTPNTASENTADGAIIGGSLGTAVGLATVAGIIPVIGPIFVAGPLVAALGIGGAVGTVVTGAVTGAVAGGLIGALASLGVDEITAKRYESLVLAGNVLITVYSKQTNRVESLLRKCGATEVRSIAPA